MKFISEAFTHTGHRTDFLSNPVMVHSPFHTLAGPLHEISLNFVMVATLSIFNSLP